MLLASVQEMIMSRSAVRQVLGGLGVVACVTTVSAIQAPQSPASPDPAAAPATTLAGSWEYSEDASKEDPRNWRRPVGATRPIPNPAGQNGGGDYRGRGGGDMMGGGGWAGGGFIPRPSSATFEGDLRRALRDLLEVAATFDIVVKPDQVVITDDLDRTLTFGTTGKKDKLRIGATNFEAKSAWDGAVLRQEIEAIGGFRMTQVYFPATDGQTMFVSMTVEKPEFKPPIKPITRTYRRVNTP
jgi:hypothetical protein